jgi:glycosyltransferase involved in cell wall biosynthesis
MKCSETDGSKRQQPCLAVVFHEDGPGGGPIAVINQLAWLKDRFSLRVLFGGRGRVAAYCGENGIACASLSGTGKKAALPFWRALRRQVRQERPDLVVSFGQWGGAVAGLVARHAGLKHVYVAEWPCFYTDWDIWRLILNRLCEVSACRGAAAVVALTAGNAYEYLYRKLATEAQLCVLPNPVDLVPAPASAVSGFQAASGFEKECRHVVSVGRLSTQKCLHWLIGAWPLVRQEVPNAMLWIVGDGELRAELSALSDRLLVGASVRFVGDRQDARMFMQAADIVVSTTMYEAFGIAVIEAMACGKAVVSNRVAGVADNLTDGVEGFLVPPADIRCLAERIARLLKDREQARRMGECGRQRAAQFSSASVMPAYEALYHRVLEAT